jgi:HlyD family secretion protein
LKRTRWFLVAAVAVVVVGAGWMWRSRAAGGAPKFRTAVAERGSIESTVAATGTVQPVEQVEVGSQVSGTVYRMYADYNSRVAEGQVLCELEPSGLNARVAQNEAAVARSEAALEDGRRQLRRARELSVQQLVSQADLEAAEVAVLQREADLKAARAQLAVVRVDQRNAIIRAPISGVVISRNIDLGQTVAASLQAPKLFVIARDLTQMQVETRIDEADIGVVSPGLPVTFTVDAFPDEQFNGEVQVVRLEPIVEQGVVTYTTVIRTRNPDLDLRPGMTANVTVRVARHDDVLKIPAAALRFRPPETGKRAGGAGSEGRWGAVAAVRGDAAGRGAGSGASTSREDAARPGVAREGVAPEGGTREGGMQPGGARAGATAGGGPRAKRAGRAPAGASVVPGGGGALPAPRPGTVHVLRGGKPVRVQVVTGLTDGTSVEILDGELRSGDVVLTGLEVEASSGRAMTPPPGMGGPMMGGRGGMGSGGHR